MDFVKGNYALSDIINCENSEKEDKMEPVSTNGISCKFNICFEKKKKVSFYLPEDLAASLNQVFYSLKMKGSPIKNKSNLMASIIRFALNDLEKNENSKLIRIIYNR